MKDLYNNIKIFRKKIFPDYRDLFTKLKDKQNPHTLFITCSDSRINPALITGTEPGELFLIRNVANLIPPYDKKNKHTGTVSPLEYAVQVLSVKNIIVCGHSNCGGCAALYYPREKLQALPATKTWLKLACNVRDTILKQEKKTADSGQERALLTEQLNIKTQLANLQTYPFVSRKVKSGNLQIIGWYYIIHSGKIFQFDKKKDKFIAVD